MVFSISTKGHFKCFYVILPASPLRSAEPNRIRELIFSAQYEKKPVVYQFGVPASGSRSDSRYSTAFQVRLSGIFFPHCIDASETGMGTIYSEPVQCILFLYRTMDSCRIDGAVSSGRLFFIQAPEISC
jgi:hypothetical protein